MTHFNLIQEQPSPFTQNPPSHYRSRAQLINPRIHRAFAEGRESDSPVAAETKTVTRRAAATTTLPVSTPLLIILKMVNLIPFFPRSMKEAIRHRTLAFSSWRWNSRRRSRGSNLFPVSLVFQKRKFLQGRCSPVSSKAGTGTLGHDPLALVARSNINWKERRVAFYTRAP